MNEENKNIEQEIDETVEEMKKKIEEISENADKVEGDLAAKAQEMKEKATDVLGKAIDKLKDLYNTATDKDELQKTVDFVKAKANELGDGVTKTFEKFKNDEQVKKTLRQVMQ